MHNWKNGMEDIWFAVKDPNEYYFNVEAVKIRRQVIAPYRSNGKPKDWEETTEDWEDWITWEEWTEEIQETEGS